MGKQEIRCPVCGSKKIRTLRYVYVCKSCNSLTDKRTKKVVDKYKVSTSMSFSSKKY